MAVADSIMRRRNETRFQAVPVTVTMTIVVGIFTQRYVIVYFSKIVFVLVVNFLTIICATVVSGPFLLNNRHGGAKPCYRERGGGKGLCLTKNWLIGYDALKLCGLHIITVREMV